MTLVRLGLERLDFAFVAVLSCVAPEWPFSTLRDQDNMVAAAETQVSFANS